MALDLEPILLPDGGGQRWIHGDPVQIDHCAAGGANKVTMRGRYGVEALLSVDHTNALDGPVLLKEQQIAVHGSQAEIRMGAFQRVIDPFSRGVGVGTADRGQDSFPLLAVSGCAFHRSSS